MANDAFELLRADIEAHIRRRVSEALGGLVQRVTALRGLAKALESAAELGTEADEERLQEAAAGIRALATEAVASAAGCIGISDRLRAYGSVRSLVATVDGAKELAAPADPGDGGGHGPPAPSADRPRRGRPRARR